jgi:hypothetical protein
VILSTKDLYIYLNFIYFKEKKIQRVFNQSLIFKPQERSWCGGPSSWTPYRIFFADSSLG